MTLQMSAQTSPLNFNILIQPQRIWKRLPGSSQLIRNTFDGIHWWSGNTETGVEATGNAVAVLHWSGDTGTRVAEIRKTVVGLHWSGDTGNCMMMIRNTIACIH